MLLEFGGLRWWFGGWWFAVWGLFTFRDTHTATGRVGGRDAKTSLESSYATCRPRALKHEIEFYQSLLWRHNNIQEVARMLQESYYELYF